MPYIMILLLVFLLSALFSGSEMGLYSVNRLRLRSRAEIGRRGAKSLRMLVRHPQRAINTILIGNNLTHYIATVCCTTLLLGAGIKRADFYSTLILAPLLVVFAEITPKMIFLKRADALMYGLASWLKLMQILFMPVLLLLNGVHSLLCLFTGDDLRGLRYHFTREKLRFFLTRGAEAGLVSPYQQKMVDNVLRVKKTTLQQALIPLDKVVMAPNTASRSEVLDIFEKNNYSRIPLYSGSREHISGLINLIDMIDCKTDEDIGQAVHSPVYLNINDSIAHALYTLQKASQQMAVVRNAAGKAVGICTVKDLVEEIVGEIYEW